MPKDPRPSWTTIDRAILETLARRRPDHEPRARRARRRRPLHVPGRACARCASAASSRASTPRSTSAALGRPLQALIAVRLAVHDREQIDAFTAAVRSLPGVLMVFHLTGVTDYLVWVAAADAQDLREFVVDHLATHPAVAHAETSLIYEHRRGPGDLGAAADARVGATGSGPGARSRAPALARAGRVGAGRSPGPALAQEALELAREDVAGGQFARVGISAPPRRPPARGARRTPGRRGRSATASDDLALVVGRRRSRARSASTDTPTSDSSLRTSASAAFGFGAAAT